MSVGGGNSNIFKIFTPKFGEDEPNLTHIFQMGWFNHQLYERFFLKSNGSHEPPRGTVTRSEIISGGMFHTMVPSIRPFFCRSKKIMMSKVLHPGRLTWNLQITHLERKMIFQASMIMFHVNLPGCMFWIQFYIPIPSLASAWKGAKELGLFEIPS